MKLLIVESPTKAKTITRYLGKKSGYTVKASVGHIRDLPKSNKKAIDIEKDFLPHYEIATEKADIVDELVQLAKKADEIILAPDPDREGEAIAWHLSEILTEEGINPKKMTRAVFHEITPTAIEDAIAHPRSIDQNLRRAQEARRVLDRLVGYDLSGIIWKKVRYGLSAGRVQSPALRILVEREKEIQKFIPEKYWALRADFITQKKESVTLTCSVEPRDEKEVVRIVRAAKKGTWTVRSVDERKQKRSPKAPFTTSTLQQAASSRLGFTPSRTMRSAQKLYEAGFITYMRTDSVTLSKEAIGSIKKAVHAEFGTALYEFRTYKNRSKNAQEAHEAVRPTEMTKVNLGSTDDQKKLYNLIRSRTLASHMVDAELLKTKVSVNISEEKVPVFAVTGSRVISEGWLSADPMARGEDTEVPEVKQDEKLALDTFHTDEKETTPPPRYSEAGLVKELEKRGIGRPSTYASIINTIQTRGYVDKESRSLKPTDTGEVVSDFLTQHFEQYVGDDFTAQMENQLDEIARGERDYAKTLKDFYKPFTKDVKAKEKLDKATDLGDAPADMLCPTCNGAMIIKLSKAGKFHSCKRFPDCIGARTIDGEELEGPKETGEKCPKCGDSKKAGALIERDGRYGRFISCNNYPKCKFIKESEEEVAKKKTGVKCPACQKGEMMERNGRFGVFYSCTEYPECKNAIKAKPTGKFCDHVREDQDGIVCGALMMEGTKTIPERCSDKTCPNHRPDRLAKEAEEASERDAQANSAKKSTKKTAKKKTAKKVTKK